MTDESSCAMCGRPVPEGGGYVVRIEVFADPQLPPMSAQEIAGANLGAALAEVMEQMKNMSPDELQDGVHRQFEYRLCPLCHRHYLANPLGVPRQVPVGRN